MRHIDVTVFDNTGQWTADSLRYLFQKQKPEIKVPVTPKLYSTLGIPMSINIRFMLMPRFF